MYSATKRQALRTQRLRLQVESLEARELLATAVTTIISGSVLDHFTSTPVSGRVVYLDLPGNGRFIDTDPTATTDASGAYSLKFTSLETPTTLTVRLQAYPGDISVPAAVTLANNPGGSVAAGTLQLQETSPVLPLVYSQTPYAGGTSDAYTAEVTSLYKDFLGRAPDSGGLRGFVAQLRTGTPLSQVATIFLNSQEYLTRAVTSYYQNDLGRMPGTPEVDGWLNAIHAGFSEEQVISGFFNSDEYSSRHADNSAFAQSLYNNVLGRQGSTAEVDHFTASLRGGVSRSSAVQTFLASPEAESRAIQGMYAVFLGRSPEPSAYPARIALLQNGETLAAMAAEIAGSGEAIANAAQAVVVPPRLPVTLAIANRVDYVFGLDGILYITDGGNVDRYNTRNGMPLEPFVLGGKLKGIDLSADGSTLAVADGSRIGIDLVKTDTGVSTSIDFTPSFSEFGAYDVAWGADGTVLITTQFEGSGAVPLRSYNPATAITTVIAPSVGQNSILSPSTDRGTIGIAESNNSGGPIEIYDVASSKLVARMSIPGGFDIYDIATNRSGTQFVVPTYFGAFVYNLAGSTLTKKTILGTYASQGPVFAVYSPTSHYLFTAEYDSDNGTNAGVKVYDTDTFTQVATLESVDIPLSGNTAFTTGWLKVSPDGATLAVSTTSGTKIYDVSAYSSGQTAPVPTV